MSELKYKSRGNWRELPDEWTVDTTVFPTGRNVTNYQPEPTYTTSRKTVTIGRQSPGISNLLGLILGAALYSSVGSCAYNRFIHPIFIAPQPQNQTLTPQRNRKNKRIQR